MNLRLARKEEFEAIRDFYWELIDLMEDQKDTVAWQKGVYPADDFLANSIERGELYVLDREGRIVASVVVNSAWNEGYEGLPWSIDCSPEDALVPHALGVYPKVQGQGIGKIIVADVIELAKSKGKKTVRLDILHGNVGAEKLYTSMGFKYVATKEMFYEDTGWTEFHMYELML